MVVGDVTTGTDVLVVGAGPGGYVAAIRAAQHDRDVTLVERDAYGGTCLNYGCIPSKAYISATDIAYRAREAEHMGIHADPAVDLEGMAEWKDGVVTRLTRGVEGLCKQAGVNLVEGRAEFAGETTARIVHDGAGEGAETVEFDHAVIATGSRPVELPGVPFDTEGVVSSRELLAAESVPESLVVVGGGYIGMELSTVFAKLGADVTVVEALDGILPAYEDDVTAVVRDRAADLGVEFATGLAATDAEPRPDDTVRLTAETETGESRTFDAQRVLVAVGREPVTDTLNLDAVGIETTDEGFLDTDEQCRTALDHVFAVGDVAGEPMLAHEASAAGKVAAGAIAGEPTAMDQQAIPEVVFTDPEIATVGLTEAEAAESGFDPVVGEVPLRSSGRALTLDEREGFVRVVAAEAGFLLGAQTVAPEASELIGELGLAVEMGATLEDVAGTVHTHPTLSESVGEAAEAALSRAIHAAQ